MGLTLAIKRVLNGLLKVEMRVKDASIKLMAKWASIISHQPLNQSARLAACLHWTIWEALLMSGAYSGNGEKL